MDFLLITQTRSGTHFLSHILEKHPQLYWKWQNNFINLLKDVLSNYHNKVRGKSDEDKRVSELLSYIFDDQKRESVLNYLPQFKFSQKNIYFFIYFALKNLYKNFNLDKKIGITTHFQTALEYGLLDICYKINKNIKIILLTRNNLLERYVSQIIRQKRENEIGYTNQLNFEPTSKTIDCSINDFKIFIKDSYSDLNKIKSIILNKKISFIEVEYLDLINNTTDTLNRIKVFLDLTKEFNGKTPFFKLEKRPLNKIINNWDSFLSDLKKENLNEYFSDNISL